jgi:hypothetical protein
MGYVIFAKEMKHFFLQMWRVICESFIKENKNYMLSLNGSRSYNYIY